MREQKIKVHAKKKQKLPDNTLCPTDPQLDFSQPPVTYPIISSLNNTMDEQLDGECTTQTI